MVTIVQNSIIKARTQIPSFAETGAGWLVWCPRHFQHKTVKLCL